MGTLPPSVSEINATTVSVFNFTDAQVAGLKDLYPINASYADPSHGGVVRTRSRRDSVNVPVLQRRQRGGPAVGRTARLVQCAPASSRTSLSTCRIASSPKRCATGFERALLTLPGTSTLAPSASSSAASPRPPSAQPTTTRSCLSRLLCTVRCRLASSSLTCTAADNSYLQNATSVMTVYERNVALEWRACA